MLPGGRAESVADRPAEARLPGFREIQPRVFAGLYPVSSDDYEDLRDALGKIRLNDSALFYEPETSQALGFGFRCGFLGMLHMEIVQERLEREYDLELITTAPTVVFEVVNTSGEVLNVDNPSKLPPANKIEEARNATVSIKMALGSGSGFFISESGYIVTNRHVIDSSYGQTEDTADQIEKVKKQDEYQARLLDQEERELRKQKAQLRRQRSRMSQTEYQHYKEQLEVREEILRQRRYQFEEQRRQFDTAYDQYEQRLISDLAQSGYTIVLADKTELQAEKVTISEKYDLALLRLKGYKTPYIPRGNANGLHHGQPLYAIGNSLDMGHTVTSGIFSGRRADLLQTNAQINPGNSGGPLITEDGRVIGINTSKVVHSSVEGVGFAIPIHVVMTEFGAYIGM